MSYLRDKSAVFGSWNTNVKLFFISNALCQAGGGMFSALYNLYVQALGYSQELNGQLVSAQSLATALLFIPIGLAGDRLNRKHLLLVGMLGFGLFSMGRSFAETEGTLQLFALLAGVFGAAAPVLAIPFLADYAEADQRLKLLSLHFSVTLAAQVLGSTGGGLLADALQALGAGRTAGLQTVLALGSASILLSSAPLLLIKESRDKRSAPRFQLSSSAPAEETQGTRQDEPLRGRDGMVIGQFAFTQLLIGIGSGLVIPYLNLYFTDRFSVSLTVVGVLISLGQIMTIISMLIGPRLVKRVGAVRAIITFQLLSLPFLLLTGFTNWLLVASFGYLFRQALMNAANPIHSAIVVDRVSSSKRGIANSINQTMFMMGWAIMGNVQPGIISAYGTYWGYALTFSLTGALYVASAACFYWMFRDRPKKRKPAPTGVTRGAGL